MGSQLEVGLEILPQGSLIAFLRLRKNVECWCWCWCCKVRRMGQQLEVGQGSLEVTFEWYSILQKLRVFYKVREMGSQLEGDALSSLFIFLGLLRSYALLQAHRQRYFVLIQTIAWKNELPNFCIFVIQPKDKTSLSFLLPYPRCTQQTGWSSNMHGI